MLSPFSLPQWWDVNCTRYTSKCVCERNGEYGSAGGGIPLVGAAVLVLIFSVIFCICGYLCAKPEVLKAFLPGGRARTAATMSVSRAGLAANDGCSSYVAPTTSSLTMPSISADTTLGNRA